MLNFRKLKLDDKKKFDDLLEKDILLCDYSFCSLFTWSHYYNTKIAIENEAIYLKMTLDGKDMYYPPISKSFLNAYDILKKHIDECGEDFNLISIMPNQKVYLEKYDNLRFIENFNNEDYIYEVEELKLLAGKKFKPKRNMVNSFLNEYEKRLKMKEINNIEKNEIIEFLDRWYMVHDESIAKAELESMMKALDHYEFFNCYGFVLYIDDVIQGLSLGSYFNDEFIIHFEKGNSEIHGIYQFIFYKLCNNIKAKYVNREEDLGIEGLRKAKLSYHPYMQSINYNAIKIIDAKERIRYALESDNEQIRLLWNEAFRNDEFDSWFFNSRFHVNNVIVFESRKEIIAMVQVFELKLSNEEKTYYIYGATTKKEYRKQNIMRSLVDFVKKEAIKNNVNCICLIPANDELFDYYKKLGFYETTFLVQKKYRKTDLNTMSVYLSNDYCLLNQLYNEAFNHLVKIKRDQEYWKDLFNSNKNIIFLTNNSDYAIVNKRNNQILEISVINEEFINAILVYLDKESIIASKPDLQGRKHSMVYKRDGKILDYYLNLMFEY